ncbi:MAG: zinc-dependent peptidase [Saprospiraceae bacterium]|nr:zinc-dependent peptidase [Saprospiraceae bacterium]
MLSRYIYIPFVIAAVVFLLTTAVTKNYDYAIYAVPCVVGLAVVYILSPQIDWWWYQKHPPALPGMVRHLINTNSAFYQNLPAAEKTRFRNRMAMYMEANEFMGQGMEAVPPDVKGIVAASAVQLTFGHEDYLLNPFEHIVIYPHRFPSPQFPSQMHTCEHFEEDGVILFSAEQLMPGFLEPQRYLNTGLYEFARVFMRKYPAVSFPQITEEQWPALEAISNFPKDKTIQYIGLREIDLTALAVVYFFDFEGKFKEILPHEFRVIKDALKV